MKPIQTPEDTQARTVWNLLEANGSIDWAGLPLAVGLLGIRDIDGLMNRLMTIKRFKRQKDN